VHFASEKAMFERFAKIGGRPFDASPIDPEIRQAIEAGIKDGQAKLQAAVAATTSFVDLFGTLDYVMRRTVGAAMWIYWVYRNPKEEAYYTAYAIDAAKQPLDGSKNYHMHFSKNQVPPAKFFWSITMYDLPARLLVENSINRFSIG
jgi:hypothetical protein